MKRRENLSFKQIQFSILISLPLFVLSFPYPSSDKIYIHNIKLSRWNNGISLIFVKNGIQTCNDRKFLIAINKLDFPLNNNGFQIIDTLENDGVEYKIPENITTVEFQVAEICIDNFQVKKNKINSGFSDGNEWIYYDKPNNFKQSMKVFPYIIGYEYEEQSDIQSIFIKEFYVDSEGFKFIFFKSSDYKIKSITINYLYYDSNLPQYSIKEIQDNKYMSINDNDNPLSKGNDNRSNKVQKLIEQEKQIISGLSGFTIASKTARMELQLEFQTPNMNITYSTWADSKIKGYTSMVLQFQMKKCDNSVYFNDVCQNECPEGYFPQQQEIDFKFCQVCNKTCKSCRGTNLNECLSCSDNNPYLLDGSCYSIYPKKSYCEKQENSNQYLCIQCPQDCTQFCDKQNKCIYCIPSKFYYKGQCQDEQPKKTFLKDGEYFDCHPSCQTCQNELITSCLTCLNSQLLSNGKCLCKESLQGFNIIDYSCQQCKVTHCSDCQDNYSLCKKCSDDKMDFILNGCKCYDTLKLIKNKCECVDSIFMNYNQLLKKCECISSETMDFNNSSQQCECKDQLSMVKNAELQKCTCSDTEFMMFNRDIKRCECIDQDTLKFNTQEQRCECKDKAHMTKNPFLKKCICIDTNTMKFNSTLEKCECLDEATMRLDSNKCSCKDIINMKFNLNSNKCECTETMKFNDQFERCECADVNNMKYNSDKQICECQNNMVFDFSQKACVCKDESFYFDNDLKNCIKNPNLKNCQIGEKYLPKCKKCQSGYRYQEGRCRLCTGGKYTDELNNQCTLSCPEYCIQCTSQINCLQYDADFPCHYSCKLCKLPNSQQGCTLCSSDTRQFNEQDSSCNCKEGYKENNETECSKIEEVISETVISSLNILNKASLYLQFSLVFLPYYPHLQYSFMLQQQIGVLSSIQGQDDKNIRMVMMSYYNDYNLKGIGNIKVLTNQNEKIQIAVNQIVMCFILQLVSLAITLLMKAIQIQYQNAYLNLIQKNLFIIMSRLLSTQGFLLIISLAQQYNQLSIQELIMVTFASLLFMAYIGHLIYNTMQIFRNKKVVEINQNKMSKECLVILEDSNTKNYQNNFNLSITNDISMNSGYKYVIWVIAELRKIILALILLLFGNIKVGLLIGSALTMAFCLSILYFRIFNSFQKQLLNVLSEILLSIVYIVSAFYNPSSSLLNGSNYKEPSALDILGVSVLVVFQIVTAFNAVYIFYSLIKSKINSVLNNKKNKNNSNNKRDISIVGFPKEFDASKFFLIQFHISHQSIYKIISNN